MLRVWGLAFRALGLGVFQGLGFGFKGVRVVRSRMGVPLIHINRFFGIIRKHASRQFL